MKYQGSCHCGKVAFEAEGEIGEVVACNCSMCQRKGSLFWFVPAASFTLKTGRDAMKTYLFNKHHIKHHFCPECGIHPFAEAKDRQGNDTAAVNVRCIEGIDIDSLKVKHFNGRAL